MNIDFPSCKLSKRLLTSRTITGFLAAATAVAMFPAQGFATENVKVQPSTASSIVQAQAVDKSSLAQALLKESASLGKKSLSLEEYKIAPRDFELAVAGLFNDPWLFYFSGYDYVYGSVMISANLRLGLGEDQAINAQDKLAKGLLDVLSWIDDSMSDEEKAQAAHDYLVRRCAYGYNGSSDKHNAYGALVEHSPVCEGYSKAYKLILDELGIPCVIVSSTSMNHAWNMVQIDDSWYHVDVTWDDPTVNGSDQGFNAPVRHDYFLKSDATLKGDHYGWSSSCMAPKDSAYKASAHKFSSPKRDLSAENGWTELGTCEWRLDEAGKLTIKPLPGLKKGRLISWQKGKAPWANKADSINQLAIAPGVETYLSGAILLSDLPGLEKADISGVNETNFLLSKEMFADCKNLNTITLSHGQQSVLDELLTASSSKTWTDATTLKNYSLGDSLPDTGSTTLTSTGNTPIGPSESVQPKSQKITASKTGTIATVSSKTLSKKAVKVSWGCNAKTTLSYKKASGDKKISVSAKTGKITLKKGLKKGSYTFKVAVNAKASSSYKATSKAFSLKVKVK